MREPQDFENALREGVTIAAPEKDEPAHDDPPQNGPDNMALPAGPVALDALLAQVSPPVAALPQRNSRGAARDDGPARPPSDAHSPVGMMDTDVSLPAISQHRAQAGMAGRDVRASNRDEKGDVGSLVARERIVAHGARGHQGVEATSILAPTRAVAVVSVTAGQHFPVIGDPVRQIASEIKQSIEAQGVSTPPDPTITSQKTLNVQLEPESLGTVTLRMRLSGNQLSVRVDVAEPATLDMLQRDRDRLQKSMTSGSVSIDQLEIRAARDPAPVTSGDTANSTRQDTGPQGQTSRQNDGGAGHGPTQRREAHGDSQTEQQGKHGQESGLARSVDTGGVYL